MVSKAQRENLQRQQSSGRRLQGNARESEGRARCPGTARPRRMRVATSAAARSAAQRQNNDASNCSGIFLTRQPRGNGRASRRAARLGAGWARAGEGAGRVSARVARYVAPQSTGVAAASMAMKGGACLLWLIDSRARRCQIGTQDTPDTIFDEIFHLGHLACFFDGSRFGGSS